MNTTKRKEKGRLCTSTTLYYDFSLCTKTDIKTTNRVGERTWKLKRENESRKGEETRGIHLSRKMLSLWLFFFFGVCLVVGLGFKAIFTSAVSQIPENLLYSLMLLCTLYLYHCSAPSSTPLLLSLLLWTRKC